MSSSELEICNSALIKVGEGVISSLSDPTKPARVCAAQYTRIRDRLLAAHPWNFATKRVMLSTPLAQAPAYGYSFQFSVPTDCLRVLEVDTADHKWEKEGTNIVTNASGVGMKYIAKVEDVSKYSVLFDELLALALAKDIAFSLSQNASLAEKLNADYKDMLRETRSFDAQEGGVRQVVADTLTNVRY